MRASPTSSLCALGHIAACMTATLLFFCCWYRIYARHAPLGGMMMTADAMSICSMGRQPYILHPGETVPTCHGLPGACALKDEAELPSLGEIFVVELLAAAAALLLFVEADAFAFAVAFGG